MNNKRKERRICQKLKKKHMRGFFHKLQNPAALFFCPYNKYNRTQLDL